MSFINIAAYKFVALSDLKSLRERLKAQCKSWGLKGTILLSTEGINLFMAGQKDAIESLLQELRAIPGLEDLQVKVSESEEQPFSRMLVRIKKEIIAFGVEGVDPGRRTSPKLPPKELKQWLDEGRAITLLDTRNDYEVKLGTFHNAKAIGIDHFRDFPDAVSRLPEELKQQPIVMFCTGGIRCEKAGPFMEMKGFEQIYQLEGGILKYFEECGSSHYDGECFVFDQRVGVDPSLHETNSGVCFACQIPLSEEDQQDPRYVPEVSCPYCFRTEEERRLEQINSRHTAIQRAITPLPGSVPYDNYRPLQISAKHDQQRLIDVLTEVFPQVPRAEWHARCDSGTLLTEKRETCAADRIVRSGERYLHLIRETLEPDVNANIQVLHEDEAIIVLDKPAPLPVHPGGRFNRNTLQRIMETVYAPEKPRAAHRLDANTTGVIVFCRSRRFAGLLQPQFTTREVDKRYLVKVQGELDSDRFSCEAPITAEPGRHGVRSVDDETGQCARTDFQVIRRIGDGTTLLEAQPITGRTNQIRIHLAHLGWPVLGDQVYGGKSHEFATHTTQPADSPLCLHSWKISFVHPISRQRVEFESPVPAWAVESAALSTAHA